MARSLSSMTLREKLSESERLTRELIHHLEHGFIPKAHALRRLAREANDPATADEITDVTIRTNVATVVETDDFTRTVSEQLTPVLQSIRQDVERILGREHL